MRRRVVVVGAGLAGLSAAATAAREGAEVTLLDARGSLGGRARTLAVDGFFLNQGAHALSPGGAGWAVLAGFGIEPRGGKPSADALGIRADERFGRLPASPSSLARSPLVSGRAKLEIARVLARPKGLGRTATAGASAQEWIDATARTPDAWAILSMVTRVATYCGDLDALDGRAAAAQVTAALASSVRYLDGGWQQLIDALEAVAVDAGVKVHAGSKADAVERVSDGLLVRTAAGDHPADAVVFAAGGPAAMDALLGGASKAVARWAVEEQPVLAAALDLGLSHLPEPEHRVVLGVDDPIYLSVHTPSAALAPDGGDVVHLLWYGDTDDDPRRAFGGADGSRAAGLARSGGGRALRATPRGEPRPAAPGPRLRGATGDCGARSLRCIRGR